MLSSPLPLLLPLLLFLLLSLSHSANVLLLCGVHGSRLLVTTEVAVKLAEFGHNVTLFTPMNDNRLSGGNWKFTFVSVEDSRSQKIKDNTEKLLEGVLDLPSPDMAIDMLVGTDRAWENMVNYTEFAAEHFEGEMFAGLLREGQFDLIVVEDLAAIPALKVLVRLDTPIIGIMSVADTKNVRDKYSLPGLMNSEPSMLNEITDNTPPSLFERITTLFRLLKVVKAYIPFLINQFKDDVKELGKDFTEYQSIYDIVFILDHPAYSFPYLAPPNTFYLGVFNLQNRLILPLHSVYTNFLENCPHTHIAYMSFGSYLKDLTQFPKAASIIRAIADMNLCVVIKSGSDIAAEFNLPQSKVLSQAWVPQKDLLGSGKVDLFISHCGNNGRLEGLFYNVPLVCVPLFADQLHNARLVQRNGFGRFITKEQLTEETFRGAVEELVGNLGVYKEKIKRATDIVVKDPGAGDSALRFYTDLLISDRSQAEFLINKIIMKQSTFEVNNLDIILAVCFAISGLVFWVLVYTCRILKFCCRQISKVGKFKTE